MTFIFLFIALLKSNVVKSTLIILFFLFYLSPASSQEDTSINLHELQITSTKLIYNSGLQQLSFDSTLKTNHAQHSLSDILNENSAISQKNYGPGGLATMSLRGGSAYQTAILWNGFSLASPLHGLTDLSLENNFFFNDISIQYGGTSALWGSGAVSGNIQLNNKPNFDSGLIITAGASAGSFSDYTEYAGITYGNSIYSGTIKLFKKNDANNYTFIDETANTEAEQTNAGINQFGLMNDNYFRTGKNSILSLKAWYSYSDRQIPPTITETNSHSNEKDINTRLSAEWKNIFGKNEFAIRSACFIESVDYTDDFLSQPSLNKARSYINEITIQKNISNSHHVQVGINHNYSLADSSANLSNKSIGRMALFGLYKFNSANEKLEFSLSGRQEFSSLNNSSFIYSTGMNYQAFRSISFSLAYSTVYRNPTINDLYWNPGGNEGLLPETGYSTEAGMRVDVLLIPAMKKNNSPSSLILNVNGYYKSIDDWIIWYPTTSSIWTPQNLSLVKSRGVEFNIEYKYTTNKFSAGLFAELFYTFSTNEKTHLANDASLHCQLIYVPVNRYNLRLYLNYKSFSLHYNHSYTGLRYTTSDNSESLPPFNIDNAEINKTFAAKNSQYRIFFRVNNIFNSSYQSIENLPMPTRSFETGLSFTFIKNKR